MYTISLSNPLAPKTSAASEIQVRSRFAGEFRLFQQQIVNYSTASFYPDLVQSQPRKRVLHHRRRGHHARRALPRLLLRSQPLHSHQGGQEQVPVTVSPARAVLAHGESRNG